MKAYNIIEIFKFEDGTKFKILGTGEIVIVETVRDVRRLASVSALTYCLYDYYINASYELVEKWEEVEFMEAMKAYCLNKTIKCSCDAEYVFTNGGLNITDLSNDDEFMDIMFNGRWFIEK